MEDDKEWVLIDTETTGFAKPICVVEIGAQRMRGWKPNGKPFRKLLNHNIDIPFEASRVHGYTRSILERDGEPAETVYQAFENYTGNLPIVSYNMNYDWDRVLVCEWERLGIKSIGTAGFCALKLAQRLLDPVPAANHKLQTLREYYRLPKRDAHSALGDVNTTADLLDSVLRPIALSQGLMSWNAICDYSSGEWYPTLIDFGKFKGHSFWEAKENNKLWDWLVWLRERGNEKAKWYLRRLSEQLACNEHENLLDKQSISSVKDTQRNGYSTYTFNNGDVYEGQWKDGKQNGIGTYTFKSGDVYEGQWKDDKQNGIGTYTFKQW